MSAPADPQGVFEFDLNATVYEQEPSSAASCQACHAKPVTRVVEGGTSGGTGADWWDLLLCTDCLADLRALAKDDVFAVAKLRNIVEGRE